MLDNDHGVQLERPSISPVRPINLVVGFYVLCILTMAGSVAADSPPVFLTKWGSSGSGDGQGLFFYLGVDPVGNVYVPDGANDRVQRFASDGTFLTKWGSQGTGDGQFANGPLDVAADGSGTVYVSSDGEIQKFTAEGTFIARFDAFVAAIAVDPTGQWVYGIVADVVAQFTTDGTFVRQWTTFNPAQNNGIAVGPSGNVYVAEDHDLIFKYTADGTFLMSWGTSGSGDGQFSQPYGIAVDSDENVYVVDSGNSRIQKFTSTGAFLTKWGSNGTGDGQFIGPRDIGVDGDGNIYVADWANNRIQKFGDAATPSAPTTWGRLKTLYREPTSSNP